MGISISGVLEWFARMVPLPWQRLAELYIGEKLALGSLLCVTLMGAIAGINRFLAGEFSWPKRRKSIKTPKRKKGFGVKHIVLLLIAILPGGLVGTATVYAVMGKEHWRKDALWIVTFSFLPALLLMLFRAAWFPWPHYRDAIYLSGLMGLIFGMLQLWALIKLLREWWGEPDECVPWWPPAAFWLQLLLLWVVIVRILDPV